MGILGNKIKALREKKGLTLEQLADKFPGSEAGKKAKLRLKKK